MKMVKAQILRRKTRRATKKCQKNYIRALSNTFFGIVSLTRDVICLERQRK